MRKSFIIYAALEFLILVAVRCTEFTLPNVIHSKIMFLAIVLNLVFAARLWLPCRKNLSSGENLIPLAFLFTVFADFFACVVMKWLIFEYIFFCCVDFCYAKHLGARLRNFIIPGILFGISLFVLKKLLPVSAELSVGWLHIILITTNTTLAWIRFSKSEDDTKCERLLFALGISLFLCCDLSIVARTIIELTGGTSPLLQAVVWTVYIPGNVLILFSCRERFVRKGHLPECQKDQFKATVPSRRDCTVTP